MTFASYIAYFKAAAESHTSIAHMDGSNETFIKMTVDDVINGLKMNANSMVFCLEPFDFKPSDALSDNPRKMISGAFTIIDLAVKGDSSSRDTIWANTESVTVDFLSKLKNDQLKTLSNSSYTNVIKGFDLNSIRSEAIGPVFGLWYGWRTEFTINQTFTNNLQLNNANWLNDTKYTL